jgi:hypothetical protein
MLTPKSEFIHERMIEYIDERDAAVPRPPVKKQIWNGTEFVTMYQHRLEGRLGDEVYAWLEKTYGPPGKFENGCYWAWMMGKYTVMDEKVYMFYKLKWGSR